MTLLPDKVKKVITPEQKKVVCQKSTSVFFFMVPDLVYQFQMICLRGT